MKANEAHARARKPLFRKTSRLGTARSSWFLLAVSRFAVISVKLTTDSFMC